MIDSRRSVEDLLLLRGIPQWVGRSSAKLARMPTTDPWPEGFPVLPGGTPRSAPANQPVRVAVLVYDGTMPKEIETDLRKALDAAGWTSQPSKAGPEAIRFSTKKGDLGVSVSIRDHEGSAVLQVMVL